MIDDLDFFYARKKGAKAKMATPVSLQCERNHRMKKKRMMRSVFDAEKSRSFIKFSATTL